jgi:nucleoside-diphosphate-sugar epimerase
MLQTLVQYPDDTVNSKTYYLGDYPEHSIQEWADMIRKSIGNRRTPVFPISLLCLMAMGGDLLQKLGWVEPPITNFRLNNMLTGSHYPIEKTETIVGHLPYSFEKGVRNTLSWMYDQNLIKHQPVN